MAISLNKAQLAELKNAIKDAELSGKKKQRLLWRLAKYGFIPAVKRYVKKQVNINGEKFKDRQSKRRKPMLAKMPKLISIKELPAREAVKLYFRGSYKSTASKSISAGVVAGLQQSGARIRQDKSQFNNKDKNHGKATKIQIKKLRDLEFKIPGSERKASKKWIAEHISRAQAGLIIRRLAKQAVKDFWTVNLPKREFFGISDKDFSKALARELKNIGFGFDVNAQDIKKGSK
jgi:hypothetical protein